LRKFIKFSIAGNIGKVSVMLVGPFLTFLLPAIVAPEAFQQLLLPLLPLQLLWLNLLTDGLLGLGLGVEPAERDIMQRAPRSPQESIFAQGMGWHIVWVGLLIAVITLGFGYWYALNARPGSPLSYVQTVIFTTLAFAQMWQALAIRSNRHALFSIGLLSNKPLLGAILLTFGLQLAVVYVPFLQAIFQTAPLSLADLGLSLLGSSLVFIIIELEKLLARREGKHQSRPSRPVAAKIS
jgi:Ca2+-transporting ATPase